MKSRKTKPKDNEDVSEFAAVQHSEDCEVTRGKLRSKKTAPNEEKVQSNLATACLDAHDVTDYNCMLQSLASCTSVQQMKTKCLQHLKYMPAVPDPPEKLGSTT